MNEIPQELPYTNKKTHNAHVGGKVIPPGQTRMVQATLHPDYHKLVKATPAISAADQRTLQLRELLALKGGMPKVLEAIGDGAKFTEADLAQLKDLEVGSLNRKGILGQLEVIKLNRAKDHDHDGEGILAMLSGENVAAGIEASDILTVEDLDILDKAEHTGAKRQNVLLAIVGKRTAIVTASYQELLAKPDAAELIAASQDMSVEDLKALEGLEYGAKEPRDAVVKAIEAKLADAKPRGLLAAAKSKLMGGK